MRMNNSRVSSELEDSRLGGGGGGIGERSR